MFSRGELHAKDADGNEVVLEGLVSADGNRVDWLIPEGLTDYRPTVWSDETKTIPANTSLEWGFSEPLGYIKATEGVTASGMRVIFGLDSTSKDKGRDRDNAE